MKIIRLLETVTLLLNRRTVTAKELADRFGVSTRTIYRDIEVLSSAGVPVYTSKGSGGGISLLEDYTLNKTMLSKNESEALLMAIKAMEVTSYPEADAILDKLGSIFNNNEANDWIEVNYEGWNSRANEQDRLSKLRDAIIKKNIVSFDYINASGERSERLAEPEKLIFDGGIWYLIAYCLKRNTHRMFRLSRIKNVEITGRTFTKREMPEYKGQTDSRAPRVVLRLRCDEEVLSRLYDTFDDECISRNDDGSYELLTTIPEDEWTYGYILSLGPHAEVLEPEHIREAIKARATKIVDTY
ncbi:MAG: YafY family transcriptional regulator [Coriobacteriia bacterium]|nr:YafY family transcriptional regulator [Coriobacteriia bacterium]